MTVLRIRGIKKVCARGHIYYYHRATGKRIKAKFGSASFLAEVECLNVNAAEMKPLPGTLGGLIDAYKQSPEYMRLAERTKDDYQRVFNYLEAARDAPLDQIDAPSILKVRDRAFKKHKRWFANYVVKVLSLIFNWGVPRGIVERNPAEKIPLIERPRDARKVNRAWSLDEVAAVLKACTKAMLVPVALGYYAGLSEGDVICMPRSAYNGAQIEWARRKTGVPVVIRAHEELRRILDAAPVTMLIAPNRWGRQYTASGFRASFFKLIRRLVAEGRVQPGLTFHGLRHTMGRDVIDSGGDTRDVMAMLGHATEAMAHRYSQEADRSIRSDAAVARLEQKRKGFGKLPTK